MRPSRDAPAQHPHDLFTTASLLGPILARMRTNEATWAPTPPGPSERPNRMLRRLVTWSYDRRRRVVVLWIAALVAASVLAGVAGGDNEMDFTVPGSDSAEAVELLEARFPEYAGGTVDIVYEADAGVADPGVAARFEALAGELAAVGPRPGGRVRAGGARRGHGDPAGPVRRAGGAAASGDGRARHGPGRCCRRRRRARRAGRLPDRAGRAVGGRLRVGRPGRGSGHPAGRVRFGAGRRPAAGDRGVRRRRRRWPSCG